MTADDSARLRYFRVLRRFDSFGSWPELTTLEGPVFRLANPADGASWNIEMYLRTHYRGDPPKDAKPVGPLIWAGKGTGGYVLGDRVVVSRGEKRLMGMQFQNAEPDQIDIAALVVPSDSPTSKEVGARVAPMIDSLAAYINLATGELLSPIAPPQVNEFIRGRPRTVQADMELVITDRPAHNAESIADLVDSYSNWQISGASSASMSVSYAARRYLTSLSEKDPVDRFCDLWEVCEFASRGTKAKGGLVGRIAQVLGTHTGYSKAEVEVGLRLRHLYSIRNDLVHNATEDPEVIDRELETLEAIAAEVLRAVLGQRYARPLILEELLTDQDGGAAAS